MSITKANTVLQSTYYPIANVPIRPAMYSRCSDSQEGLGAAFPYSLTIGSIVTKVLHTSDSTKNLPTTNCRIFTRYGQYLPTFLLFPSIRRRSLCTLNTYSYTYVAVVHKPLAAMFPIIYKYWFRNYSLGVPNY